MRAVLQDLVESADLDQLLALQNLPDLRNSLLTQMGEIAHHPVTGTTAIAVILAQQMCRERAIGHRLVDRNI